MLLNSCKYNDVHVQSLHTYTFYSQHIWYHLWIWVLKNKRSSTLVERMLWLISGGLLRFILSYPNGFVIQIFPGKESLISSKTRIIMTWINGNQFKGDRVQFATLVIFDTWISTVWFKTRASMSATHGAISDSL